MPHALGNWNLERLVSRLNVLKHWLEIAVTPCLEMLKQSQFGFMMYREEKKLT